jgi:hypothetical protein
LAKSDALSLFASILSIGGTTQRKADALLGLTDEPYDFYESEAAAFLDKEGFAGKISEEEFKILDLYSRFTGRSLADAYTNVRSEIATRQLNGMFPEDSDGDMDFSVLNDERYKEANAVYELMLEFSPNKEGDSYKELFPDRTAAENFFKLEKGGLRMMYDISLPGAGEEILKAVGEYQERALAENFP